VRIFISATRMHCLDVTKGSVILSKEVSVGICFFLYITRCVALRSFSLGYIMLSIEQNRVVQTSCHYPLHGTPDRGKVIIR
jgi:uncharacterized protein (DUF486 family)